MDYEVTAINVPNPDPEVTITWVNPRGESVVLENQSLSGRILWPGAVLDASGEIIDWPGWQLVDGTWIQGDEWDWVRPSAQVIFSVNPSVRTRVEYPPATSGCNPPSPTPSPTPPPTPSPTPTASPTPLPDVVAVSSCDGTALTDVTNFRVGLYPYSAADPTGANLANVLSLTPTEIPDVEGNGVPLGLDPNGINQNPMTLANASRGLYNFLLDPGRGQLDPSQTYLLRISPPLDSPYAERLIRLRLGAADPQGRVAYEAVALDGRRPWANDTQPAQRGFLPRLGAMGVVSIPVSICEAQAIQIQKSGDRATVAPGDTLIYRITVRNVGSTPIQRLRIEDSLPLGFRYIVQSVRAASTGTPVDVQVTEIGSLLTFTTPAILEPRQTLTITYAVLVTPDALRGSGINSAVVNGTRVDNDDPVNDGPATFPVGLQQGILRDLGTLLGRVFEDRNFDGEQQPGEPGIPDAVVILDDGTRVTTDSRGLFSISNVMPGYRTGVLDLTSVPDYTLAPNRVFIERNSQSRLVRLAPGGLARMNFAVVPLQNREEEP
ncbi:MAG: hypothetical protein OHK0012_12670 [Synechococcales cyanobacterium]